MSEPYTISGDPVSVVRETACFTVEDDEGVVHVGRTLVRPVYGGHNNIIEEPIDVTDCDIEVAPGWREGARFPVVTCVTCLGSS